MEAVIPTPFCLTHRAYEDYELVQQAVHGDQQAYAALMDRYRQSVYHTMFRMVRNSEDATDLMMEAFGKAFCSLVNYVPRHAFSTWLFKIAINNCIDHIRRKRLVLSSLDECCEVTPENEFGDSLRDWTRNPEEQFIRKQRLDSTRSALMRLDRKYRLMIEMRYFEELTYDEIAVEMNLPLGTVKAQLFRAKELLYELLQKPGYSNYLESTKRKGRKEVLA